MVRAVWLAAGGSILAARKAIEQRAAVNIGGGFHHAFADHGEGFCAIHDVAIAIRRLQKDGLVERAAVVDCDVHQGNGTAAIFAGDASVFTLSLHQENNYPSPKPPSDLDVNLADGTGDDEYLEQLAHALHAVVAAGPFQLWCYVAGADPYGQDQLGGLGLTIDGLRRRDQLVFGHALSRSIPIMVTLAGGYARRVEDTVTIHANTVRALQEVL
jgi:acetoin utilization deacetylase AcuC-like enzyme